MHVQADYLSHVSAMQHHVHRLRSELFHALDGVDARSGPHSIDRFATAENCQPLQAPHMGRFCSNYCSPAAVWIDAVTCPGRAKIIGPPPTARSAPPADRGGGPYARFESVRHNHRAGNVMGGVVVRAVPPSTRRAS